MPEHRVVHAEPTKEFFIYMLTVDIPLAQAIVDLVDNSVDGALLLRGKQRFNKLRVELTVSPNGFTLQDNCGGFPVEVAEKYAFRFGRPKGAPALDRSIGRFGVGMKRAFFKLGNRFRVESRTTTEHWVIEADVREWRDAPPWEFTFSKVRTGLKKCPISKTGTHIEVTDLHPDVAQAFALQNFRTELKEIVEVKHQASLDKGLGIWLNEARLERKRPVLRESTRLRPHVSSFPLRDVEVRLYAGIYEPDPKAAGWHVYCNNRVVLAADQSRRTGWGRLPPPRFHPQYNRFRGYAFFEADDPSSLPWTTTKNDVDEDSGVFRSARQRMVVAMLPVIRFLDRLDQERTKAQGDSWLDKVIESAPPTQLGNLEGSGTFQAPDRPPTPARVTQRIQYDRPKDKIDRVKKALRVSSAKAVGEGTFDYFFKRVCED
jgi:hypothetical protein